MLKRRHIIIQLFKIPNICREFGWKQQTEASNILIQSVSVGIEAQTPTVLVPYSNLPSYTGLFV